MRRAPAGMIAVRGGAKSFVLEMHERYPRISVESLAELVGESVEWVEELLTAPSSQEQR